MPLVSVVVPVYNRLDELRRALNSLTRQTLADFECIVVDDCSTEPIQSVVEEFDERFVYVRRDANGGCTAAHISGLEHVRGDLVTRLDSDNEFFPWTLDRAAHYLEAYPQAARATGLYVFPDGFRTRIGGGVKVVGPDEFVKRSSPAGDSVGVNRRFVVEEWLRLGRDYYNLDMVFTLQLRLSHPVVLVDEPWGRYHTASSNRLTGDPFNPRELEDAQRFVAEFRPRLGNSPCGPVDIALIHMWSRLIRTRRYREAAAVADWMHERGISRSAAMRRRLSWASRQRISSLLPRPRPRVL